MENARVTPINWAETSTLSTLENDCVTAVVLKILDRKCKMPADQQEAMLAIYDVIPHQPGGLFDQAEYQCIEQALQQQTIPATLAVRIHEYRVKAEENIPKPVMKAFKARLREELFERTAVIGNKI